MEYTVIADDGIDFNDNHFAKGETVVLTADDAAPFVESGSVQYVETPPTPEGEGDPEGDESAPGGEQDENSQAEPEIDPLTGAPKGDIDTSSLPPETIPSTEEL